MGQVVGSVLTPAAQNRVFSVRGKGWWDRRGGKRLHRGGVLLQNGQGSTLLQVGGKGMADKDNNMDSTGRMC